MATYYYNGREGDPLAEATIHTDEHCADESDEHSARPIAGLDPDPAQMCPDCSPSAISVGPDARDLIDASICPWCDSYEGDHVGQHASSAHPEKWDAYTDD